MKNDLSIKLCTVEGDKLLNLTKNLLEGKNFKKETGLDAWVKTNTVTIGMIGPNNYNVFFGPGANMGGLESIKFEEHELPKKQLKIEKGSKAYSKIELKKILEEETKKDFRYLSFLKSGDQIYFNVI